MTTRQCPCGEDIESGKSYHRGFDLVTASGVPDFVYMHFCSIPCRNSWIKQSPIYEPPPPKQPVLVPSWDYWQKY